MLDRLFDVKSWEIEKYSIFYIVIIYWRNGLKQEFNVEFYAGLDVYSLILYRSLYW